MYNLLRFIVSCIIKNVQIDFEAIATFDGASNVFVCFSGQMSSRDFLENRSSRDGMTFA